MKKLLGMAVAAALVMTAAAVGIVAPVGADSGVCVQHVTMSGTVRYPTGQPIPGATVTDDPSFGDSGGFPGVWTQTDADGRYTLSDCPGSYTLVAFSAKTDSAYVQVDAVQDVVVDFTLPYFMTAAGLAYVNTASAPATAHILAETYAPNPGQPGQAGAACVFGKNDTTGEVAPATYAGPQANGTDGWAWATTMPQGLAEGYYQVWLWAEDCATGARLTNLGGDDVYVDDTAPEVRSVYPTAVAGPSVTVGVNVFDRTFSKAASSIAVDGAAMPVDLVNCDLCVQTRVTGLSAGTHSVTGTAVDQAGNTTPFAFSITVDDDPPVLSHPAPTGSTASPTPTLSIRATDDLAGVAPKSGRFVLTDRFGRTSTLVPAYDQATGTFTYQVPAVPSGTGPGQSPLAPGTYTVRFSAADAAGNAAATTWSFTVQPSADAPLPT